MQEYLKNNSKSNGRWTKQEHLKFLEGLRIYGKNWKKIEQLVQTRSGSQIRSHAQKFFLKPKGAETASEQEQWIGGADLQEQHQQITENSKSVGESQSYREGMSYFLGRIVDYSTGRTCLDFWEDLVDIKGASEYAKEQERKNSFTNVDEEEQDSLSERPPQKKVKV